MLRLLSSVANIDSQRLRTGFLEEMDFTRLAPAMNALAEAPIYIDDTPEHQHHGAAHQGAAAPGRVRPRPDHRRLPPADAVERPVARCQPRPGGERDLARAQGARARAAGPGRRAVASSRARRSSAIGEPRLSDLRESGALEQDSDLVMFLWREKERRDEPGRGWRGHQPAARQAPQRSHRRDASSGSGSARRASSSTRTRSATRSPRTPRSAFSIRSRPRRRLPAPWSASMSRPASRDSSATSSGSIGRSASRHAAMPSGAAIAMSNAPPFGTSATRATCSGREIGLADGGRVLDLLEIRRCEVIPGPREQIGALGVVLDEHAAIEHRCVGGHVSAFGDPRVGVGEQPGQLEESLATPRDRDLLR